MKNKQKQEKKQVKKIQNSKKTESQGATKENKKINKGITLIALVVTIIILIILAGVTLSIVLGKNGLLAKARKGAEDYQYAGIKERVESEILALDIQKVAKGEKLTIEDALLALYEKGTFEEIDIDSSTGVCEGYVIELGYNENEKVVINGITKDTGVRIVAKVNPVGYTKENVEVTISVKTSEQEVSSIEVPTGMTQKQGTEEKDHIYEVEANGTYHIKATLNDGTVIEKDIVIANIDKLSPQEFTITAENTGTGIIVTAKTEDAEADTDNAKSGIDRYEYYVKKKEEANTAYQKYDTNAIKDLDVGTYNVYAVAYDKAKNDKQSDTIEVEVQIKLKFQQISAGKYHSLGIDMNGSLWAWGYNGNGRLGDGTTNAKKVPTKITIEGEENKKWKQISAGGSHSLAIDEDGNLWSWGLNSKGQLGIGTNDDKLVPTKITIEEEQNKKWKQVSAGDQYSLAIDEDGNLWSWGYNHNGELGDGTTGEKNVPTKITIEGEENKKWKQIYAGYDHSLVIDENDNLWSMGYNAYGQLGDGTIKDKHVPTKITVAEKTNITWKQVSAGDDHNLAIDTEGNLWVWGNNTYGQLGDGTTGNKNVPTKITIEGEENKKWKQVSAGGSHCLAIDTDGNL